MSTKRKAAVAADDDSTVTPSGSAASEFRFCSVAEVDRLIALLNGAQMISGVQITPGMRLAFGAHQILLALLEASKTAKPAAAGPGVRAYLLEAVAQLLNQISGADVTLTVVHPKPPGDLH